MLLPCTVSGHIEQPTGVVASGPIVFTPERFVDIDDEVIVAQVPVVVTPDPITAAFSVDLHYSRRVTGDAYIDAYVDNYAGLELAPPAHYTVQEPFGDTYCIQIDDSLGGAVKLADAPRC